MSDSNNITLTLYNKEISTTPHKIAISHQLTTFGFSIYDTILIKNYIPLFYKEHMSRTYNTISYLGFTNPNKIIQDIHLDLQKILLYSQQKKMSQVFLRLKILIFPEEVIFPDIQFDKINYFITLKPISQKTYNTSQKYQLYLSSYKKPVITGYPSYIKFLANQIHIMATKESQEKMSKSNIHTDALLVDTQDNICESSFGNIFIQKDNTFYTPSIKHNLLNGITRNILSNIFHQYKIPIVETTLRLSDLLSSQECYITSSIRGIQPIESIIYEEPTSQKKKHIQYSNQSAQKIQDYYLHEIQKDFKQNISFLNQKAPKIFL